MKIAPDEMPFEMWRRRLDKTPSGAPAHPVVLDLLKQFCTDDEALFLSKMPAKFCSAEELARLQNADPLHTQNTLDTLVHKYLVGDMDCGDGIYGHKTRLDSGRQAELSSSVSRSMQCSRMSIARRLGVSD